MSLFDSVASLGAAGIRFVRHVGEAGCMLFRALVGRPEIKKHFPLLVRQIYVVGVLSVTIILVSGLFIGMVATTSSSSSRPRAASGRWSPSRFSASSDRWWQRFFMRAAQAPRSPPRSAS